MIKSVGLIEIEVVVLGREDIGGPKVECDDLPGPIVEGSREDRRIPSGFVAAGYQHAGSGWVENS